KIVANIQCGVVRIRPWTYARKRSTRCREGRLNGIAKDAIGIHTGAVTAMSDQRLHSGVINECAFAVLFDCKIGPNIALSDYGGIRRLNLPCETGLWQRVRRRSSPRRLIGGGRHVPIDRTTGDMGREWMRN